MAIKEPHCDGCAGKEPFWPSHCTGCGAEGGGQQITEAGQKCDSCRNTWVGDRTPIKGEWWTNGTRHAWTRVLYGWRYDFYMYPNGDTLVYAHRYGDYTAVKYGKHGRMIKMGGAA